MGSLAFVLRPALGLRPLEAGKLTLKAICVGHHGILCASELEMIPLCAPETFMISTLPSNMAPRRAQLRSRAAVLNKFSSSRLATLVAPFIVVKEPRTVMFEDRKIAPLPVPAKVDYSRGRRGFNWPERVEIAKYHLETVLTWDITAQTLMLWSLFATVVLAGAYFYQRTTGLKYQKAFWLSWCALSGAEPDFSGKLCSSQRAP
jgi:hypothetical protein